MTHRVSAVLAVSVAVLVVAPHASADEWSPAVTAEGWAWRAKSTAVPSPAAGAPATLVAEGQLAVSQAAGMPEKVSFLRFADDGLRDGEVESLELVLRLSEDGASAGVDGAVVAACVVVEAWDGSAVPMSWDARPETDCSQSVVAEYDGVARAFRFVLDPLLPRWRSGAVHGVALQPATTPPGELPTSFHLVFDGAARHGVMVRAAGSADPSTSEEDEVEEPASAELAPAGEEFSSGPVPPSVLPLGEAPGTAVGESALPAAASAGDAADAVRWQWVSLLLLALATLPPLGRLLRPVGQLLGDPERLLAD